MREIKFRAKTVAEQSRWAYGSLISYADGSADIYGVDALRDGLKSELIIHINPDTVGQYTGHTDMYGQEIYEGDVLKSMQGRFVVGWGSEHAGFEVFQICKGRLLFLSYLYEDMSVTEDTTEYPADYKPERWEWDWEIIGNIHDNPELLNYSLFH